MLKNGSAKCENEWKIWPLLKDFFPSDTQFWMAIWGFLGTF